VIFGVAARWPRVREPAQRPFNSGWDIFPGVGGTLAHDGGQGHESGSVQRAGWPPGELRRE
jgi:hypothetical protein